MTLEPVVEWERVDEEDTLESAACTAEWWMADGVEVDGVEVDVGGCAVAVSGVKTLDERVHTMGAVKHWTVRGVVTLDRRLRTLGQVERWALETLDTKLCTLVKRWALDGVETLDARVCTA